MSDNSSSSSSTPSSTPSSSSSSPAAPVSSSSSASARLSMDRFLHRATSSVEAQLGEAKAFLGKQKEQVDTVNKELLTKYNNEVAKPVNEKLHVLSNEWNALRRKHAGYVVGGITAGVALFSVPFGRFSVLRNSLIALGLSAAAVAPSTAVGTVAILKDTIAPTPALRTIDEHQKQNENKK